MSGCSSACPKVISGPSSIETKVEFALQNRRNHSERDKVYLKEWRNKHSRYTGYCRVQKQGSNEAIDAINESLL